MNADLKYSRSKNVRIRHLRIKYRRPVTDHFLSFIGGFTAIMLIGVMGKISGIGQANLFLIGSFGASVILVFGEPKSPPAQPYNLVGGHVFSAVVGVSVALLPLQEVWIAAALAVAVSLMVMKIAGCVHPPGGATALIAVIGGEKIQTLGYWYVLFPVASGALILLVTGLLVNNLDGKSRYPLAPVRLFTYRFRWPVR